MYHSGWPRRGTGTSNCLLMMNYIIDVLLGDNRWKCIRCIIPILMTRIQCDISLRFWVNVLLWNILGMFSLMSTTNTSSIRVSNIKFMCLLNDIFYTYNTLNLALVNYVALNIVVHRKQNYSV